MGKVSLWHGSIVFVGGVAIAMVVVAWLHPPNSDSSAWAAWAQAFGSVAAIFAAIFIALKQSSQAAETHGRDRARRYAEIFAPCIALAEAVAEDAEAAIRVAAEGFDAGSFDNDRRAVDRFSVTAELVAKLNPTVMPSVASVRGVQDMQDITVKMRTVIEGIYALQALLSPVSKEQFALAWQWTAVMEGILGRLKSDLARLTIF
jgi:hypothetical protein